MLHSLCVVLAVRPLSSLHLEASTMLSSSLRGQRDSCDVNVKVPNPMAQEYLDGVYDEDYYDGAEGKSLIAGSTKYAGDFAQMHQAMQTNISEFAESCRGKRLLKVLLDDGLILNYFGMDFTQLYRKRHGKLPSGAIRTGHEMEYDDDVNEILGLMYPTRVSRFVEKVDFPQMIMGQYKVYAYEFNPVARAFGLSQSEMEDLRFFQKNGFLIVDKWPQLNMVEHLVEYNATPDSKHQDKPYVFGAAPAPEEAKSLSPMLDASSYLMKISSAYLGSLAEAHSTGAFTLAGKATKKEYSNAPWHFDGCGRRLKAWVYHHDIDVDTHPTTIVAGTQTNHWFPSLEYFVGERGVNKLSEQMVEKEFAGRVHTMLGKAGGGFLFDSNAIHGALMSGEHQERRTTLIEISTKEHNGLPREAVGADDGYLSAWGEGLCPSVHDR